MPFKAKRETLIYVLTLWESLQGCLQHLGVSPGCPQAPGLCRSSSTCPDGAGMLQGWDPGMPARGREGHLVYQSLEHQSVPYSLSSPGIFHPALMWTPLTTLQCPHSTQGMELCALWCLVSTSNLPGRRLASLCLPKPLVCIPALYSPTFYHG